MSNKKPQELLQILQNHLFFSKFENNRTDYFFKVSLFKSKILIFHEETDSVTVDDDYTEELIKKKMMKYVIDDCKLLFENIPKVKLVILTDQNIEEEERRDLIENLNQKIDEFKNQISQLNINDLINESYKRIIQ